MSISGIAVYSLRAISFAAIVCLLYWLFCRLRGRKPGMKRMLGLFYIAALVQITVIRGGVNWQDVLHGNREAPRLVPLRTMRDVLAWGWWPSVYNIVGNLIWFVPLGLMLGKRKGWQALAIGAAVSAGIELGQYILITGATDIDDVILNAIGAWLGWLILKIKPRCK